MRFFPLLFLAFAFPAFSQTTCAPIGTTTPIPWNEARLTWVAPTKNTDGSNISGAIVYTVYKLLSAGGGTWTAQCTTSAVSTSLTNQATATGPQSYRVTAKVPSNTNGIESAPSNVAMKTMTLPPVQPNPPDTLTIAADSPQTAYSISSVNDAIVALEVGQIPAGTTCDTSQFVQPFGKSTLYRVNIASVQWLPRTHAEAVFARCSAG